MQRKNSTDTFLGREYTFIYSFSGRNNGRRRRIAGGGPGRQGNKLDVGSVRPYGEGTGNRRLFSGRVKRLQVVCKSVLYWPANPGTGALPGCRGRENRRGKRRSSELAMSDGGNLGREGGEAGPREAGRGGNDSINLFHAFPPLASSLYFILYPHRRENGNKGGPFTEKGGENTVACLSRVSTRGRGERGGPLAWRYYIHFISSSFLMPTNGEGGEDGERLE